MTVPLESERLLLRPVTLADAPSLQRHFAHWSIIGRLSTAVPWPYPDDGMVTHLAGHVLPGVDAGRLMAWSLVPKQGTLAGEAAGLLVYRLHSDDHRGFWLAESLWGQGLMTEAITCFQDHVFFDLGVERLVVHNAVANLASRRVKEKTGAVWLAHVQIDHRGGSDAEQWEITRDRWAELRGR